MTCFGIIRRIERKHISHYGMIRNYMVTARRNFVRQKWYTIINITGLACGLACCLFIFLWIIDEVSYDQFHREKEKIFQVIDNQTYNGEVSTTQVTPGPLAEALKTDVPEIDLATRVSFKSTCLLTYKEKVFYEEGVYADPDFFKIFTFQVIVGDKNNPLPDQSSIAISSTIARKYFGSENPLGKVYKIDGATDLKVTAVFLDVQKNSTLQFNFVGPFSLYLKSNPWFLGWGANGLQTFVTLNDPKSHSAVNKKILNMVKRKYYEESPVQLWLQPYTRIRLYSNFANGKEDGGRIDYVRIFGGVAVFILFLACINFMNLATARASHRVKEVCVRKVVGARRYSLIFQFLGESVLLSMVSLLIAILIVQLFLPFFNELTSKEITIAYGNSTILSGLVSISLITGLMAGSYPAVFLSSFNPLLVLIRNFMPAVSASLPPQVVA